MALVGFKAQNHPQQTAVRGPRADAERRAVEVVSETTDFELRCLGEIGSQEYVRRLRALVKKRRKS